MLVAANEVRVVPTDLQVVDWHPCLARLDPVHNQHIRLFAPSLSASASATEISRSPARNAPASTHPTPAPRSSENTRWFGVTPIGRS